MENIVADLGLSGVGALEADENLNISDVIDVIRSTDPEFSAQSMYSGGGPVEQGARAAPSSISQIKKKAFVQITEQPASKALRFRYECEGRSAGSIPGVNSTPENKTFPSIQVVGYRGRAIIVVSCVTKDAPYRPHPHNLVGKEGCKKGICTVEINSDSMSCTFSNLGIQCVKKKDIEEALKQRESIRVDPYRTGFAHRSQPSGIDLNAVRLCFQVFLEGDEPGKFSFPLKPVVSDPIYDKKAMSDLVICKLSHCSCSVAGGQEIILLCEKVAKEDISVRFYEEQSGQLVWEGFGDFQHTNVHKQTAISFRAPRYRTLEVDRPVKVFIQLRRPSDGATSEPLPFELLPLDSDPIVLKRKRQKYGGDANNFLLRHLQNHAPEDVARVTQTPFNMMNIPLMSMQPDEHHLAANVKAEPRDPSPLPYNMFGGNYRTVPQGSPSPQPPPPYPMDPNLQYSPVDAQFNQMPINTWPHPNMQAMPQDMLNNLNAGQDNPFHMNDMNNLMAADPSNAPMAMNIEPVPTNVSGLLAGIPSAELTAFPGLSGYLEGTEPNRESVRMDAEQTENMTDSFTRLTTAITNNITDINNMYNLQHL